MPEKKSSFLSTLIKPKNLDDAIPLRRKADMELVQDQHETWSLAIENVVQEAIRNIRERSEDNFYISGIRDLESTCFCQSLMSLKKRWGESFEGISVPHEVEVFSNPVGLIAFQVHDRKYNCIKYPTGENSKANSHEYQEAIRESGKYFSSVQISIDDIPSPDELVSILIDHLGEDLGKGNQEFLVISDDQDNQYVVGDVLRPRRSAILDWQHRLEEWITDKYNHKNDRFYFYSYPIVDLIIKDGKYLVLLLVSPLDLNFVDEKVTKFNRCAEITLAIFNVENLNYTRVIQSAGPQLKQAYGRVLFTNMHEEATRALMATFDDQSKILRHWVRMASKGYDGLIDEGISQGIFDSTEFLKSIVKKVLCADIQNVKSELYPFDRAFIFREAGSSAAKSIKEPIEITIMEAATLSKNPADRNQYLTARERRIRTTQDYERVASRKIIKDENVFTFYLHNFGNDIIFTQKSKLSKDDKKNINSDQASSQSTSDANKKIIKIKPIENISGNEISSAFSNLVGRLLKDNSKTKVTRTPKTNTIYTTETFTEEFEKERQTVTESFDPRGLFYAYDHGIHLSTDIPLLSQIQNAYFEFQKSYFQDRDKQHRRDRYSQDNLDEEQMKKLINEESAIEKQRQRKGLPSQEVDLSDSAQLEEKQTSKVIYIAFSWELHDENMDILKKNITSEDDSPIALLDEEFIYTLILVSDLDPEKSLSELNSRRENLRLFFQLIMERIWMDRKLEREKLYNRSAVIANSLTQFSHRAQSFIKVKKHREYLKKEIEKLQTLTQAKGTTAKLITLRKPEDFFARIFTLPKESEINPAIIEREFKTWLSAVFANSSRDINRLKLNIEYRGLPELRVRWSDPVLKEAIDNAVKNASEAALDNPDTGIEPEVTIQLQAFPEPGQDQTDWFFYVLIENTGGPIPERKLRKLNSPNPKPMESQQKEGGNGLGVFLSRFQLINDIGAGADLVYTNLENGNVQTRLRLPATLINKAAEKGQEATPKSHKILKDYILYVEDFRDIYEKTIIDLRSAFRESDLDVLHKKSLLGAKEIIDTRFPTVIFSDYNILKEEDGRDASPRYGLQLIKHILSKAHDLELYPPIWILTAEKESGILKILKDEKIDLGSCGYKLVPGIEEYSPDSIQPGAFLILSEVKNPTEIKGFGQVVNNLTASENLMPDESIFNHDSIKIFDLSQKGFDSLEADYSSTLISDPAVIYYGHAVISNHDQLFEKLKMWFSGPSLNDPELLDTTSNEPKPIYSHFFHDRILLNLEVESALYEQIPIELIYWGLSNNLLFTSKDFGLEKAISGWKTIKHDDKGPIAKFRHDMKNIFYDAKYEKVRRKLQEGLDNIESLLKNDAYDFLKLEGYLLSQESTSEVLKVYQDKAKTNQEKRNQLSKITYGVNETLGEAKDISDGMQNTILSFQQTVYYFKEFLGVN